MKKGIITVLLAVLFVGCDDFGDINTDPNNPSSARTELLLTNAQRSMDNVIGAVTGTLYVQYFSETQYPEASQYETINFNFNGWYNGPLQDLQTIIDLNSNEETAGDVLSGGSNANQIAVARILQTWYYHMITDRWGMVPYSEALQGRENLQPAYDSQQDIYNGMLTELTEAVTQISTSEAGVTGDILFNGDMEKWQQFANTLRMRIALRLSEVDAATAESQFTSAMNATGGVLDENVMYPYLGSATNENPWYSRFRTRTDYAISEVMADTMKAFDDMRLTAYADPAPDEDNNNGVTELSEIVGMPYGIGDPGSIPNSAISFPGHPAVRGQDTGLPIFTLAEIHFSMAEAAQRGWITGDAATLYEEAIQHSWEQWGVYEQADFNNYMSNAEVAYSSAEWRQKIGFQKWAALFPLGYEAWSEWRRLGYPELEPAPVILSNVTDIPVRHGYPTSETELNTENYNAAVSSQGEDDLGTHLWWDPAN